ncbi:MAG: 16S rRNA (uracil(1498)-N(3))-methyltransferase [Verrucomicrobiales bacterium]|nr:16S rRNA (uracil(1498)-N(3))-methyltransferase [Verrucomicrobiales bacterium]
MAPSNEDEAAGGERVSLSRYFLPPSAWPDAARSGVELELVGEEAHHCVRVRRQREGQEVEIFDGEGQVARCRLTALGRDSLRALVLEARRHAPLPWRVHLQSALIKGEAWHWLVEKAVELGAASLQPVVTARVVARMEEAQTERKLEKWRRHMLEAAKQCHTPFLPTLHAPVTLEQAVNQLARTELGVLPSLAGRDTGLLPQLRRWQGLREARVLTGPEGDFTAEEEACALAAGYQPVTLGPLILRAETAVTAVLAVLGQAWGFEEAD